MLDFRILPVILILIFFVTFILPYFKILTVLFIVFLLVLFLVAYRRSKRDSTSPANTHTVSRKGNENKLTVAEVHSQQGNTFNNLSAIYFNGSMQRNGFANSSFNDSKFDSSFNKWRASPRLNSSQLCESPLGSVRLRTRKGSQPVSRRHSFSVNSSFDNTTTDNVSRIPFLPTVKRALGLETIVSPRYVGTEKSSNYTSHPEIPSPGFFPAVRLGHHDKHPLSNVRSPTIRSPNTVKIAPPDPHKLSSPKMIEMRRKDLVRQDSGKTPDKQTVLTALKEKRRKRTAGTSECDTYNSEMPMQKAKRRRQESQQSNASTCSLPPLPDTLPDLSISDYTIPRLETPSLKRAAVTEAPGWERQSNSPKRLRHEGRYNSISSSLSSSRRGEGHERSNSPRPPNWSQMQYEKSLELKDKENLDLPVNTKTKDPDKLQTSIQRAETVMLPKNANMEDQTLNTSEVEVSSLDQSQSQRTNLRQKVTLNKSFSVRKRQMSLYSGLNKSFTKVPKSNVVACMEDYEADREAEQKRVEQMLDDIVSSEEINKAKTKETGVSAPSLQTSSATVPSTTAPSQSTVTSNVNPTTSLSVNAMFGSNTKSTGTQNPVQPTSKLSVAPSLVNFGNSTSLTVSSGSAVTSRPSLGTATHTTMSTPTAVSSGIGNTGLGTAVATSTTSVGLSFTPVFGSIPSTGATSVTSTTSAQIRGGFTATTSVGTAAAANPLGQHVISQTATSAGITSTNLLGVTTSASQPATFTGVMPTSTQGGFSFGIQQNQGQPNATSAIGVSGSAVTTQNLSSATPSFGVTNKNTGTATSTFGTAAPGFGQTGISSSGVTSSFSFGGTTTSNPQSSGVFGGVAPSQPSFGATSTAGSSDANPPKFTPVFGTNPNQTNTAATFGSAQSRNTPTFGTNQATGFGNTTQGFGVSQSGPTFSATQTSTTASAVLNFGQNNTQPSSGSVFGGATRPTSGFSTSSSQSGSSSIFGATPGTNASTFNFAATATTAAPNVNFGATAKTTASTFNFGGTAATPAPAVNFGAQATTAASTFNFAAKPATTASAFGFGAPVTTTAANVNFGATAKTTASTFNFGGTAATPAPAVNFGAQATTAASTFNFGATAKTTAATFNFGATTTAAPTANFGAPAATGASTFGFGAAATTTASGFNFGATTTANVGATSGFNNTTNQTSSSMFGGAKPQSNPLFQGVQSGMTKSGSAPAFGTTGPTFGGSQKPNPFGSASTNVFGVNPTPQSVNQGGSGGFGFPGAPQTTSNNSSGGFSFTGAASEGGAGATPTFNFSGNSNTSFGASTPAFAATGSPSPGMFTMGAASTATKPRISTKAKRRVPRR